MSGNMSREKGKRGEREWARFCREQGYACRRTSQYCGRGGDASDVVGLPGVHQEVKRVERLDLYGALDQARRDAGPGQMPVVFHRKNDHRWVAVLDAGDFFRLYRAWEGEHGGESS